MVIYKKINIKEYKEKEFYRKTNAKLRNQLYVPEPIINVKFVYKYNLENVAYKHQ